MKKPTGSRALIVKQLVKVLENAIPRLETPEQAEELESQIYIMWKNGVIDDALYNKLNNGLLQVCKIKNW